MDSAFIISYLQIYVTAGRLCISHQEVDMGGHNGTTNRYFDKQ